MRRFMKILWLIVSLIPVSFLFHYYEYGQHIKREEATFLFVGSLSFILVTGILSRNIKLKYVFLVNIVNGIVSLLLASNFIIDDGGWFKPVGRDVAVIISSFIFLIGQLLVRLISRRLIK